MIKDTKTSVEVCDKELSELNIILADQEKIKAQIEAEIKVLEEAIESSHANIKSIIDGSSYNNTRPRKIVRIRRLHKIFTSPVTQNIIQNTTVDGQLIHKDSDIEEKIAETEIALTEKQCHSKNLKRKLASYTETTNDVHKKMKKE